MAGRGGLSGHLQRVLRYRRSVWETRLVDLKECLADLKKRHAAAKELYLFEPAATKRGESAGSRTEGRDFRKEMKVLLVLLAHPGYEIHTAIGKSSNQKTLDGSAHERLAFKMLSFKTSALKDDLTLIVALNHAFATYSPHFYAEIVGMAASLNVRGGGPIVILGTPQAYDGYFERLEREIRRQYQGQPTASVLSPH